MKPCAGYLKSGRHLQHCTSLLQFMSFHKLNSLSHIVNAGCVVVFLPEFVQRAAGKKRVMGDASGCLAGLTWPFRFSNSFLIDPSPFSHIFLFLFSCPRQEETDWLSKHTSGHKHKQRRQMLFSFFLLSYFFLLLHT